MVHSRWNGDAAALSGTFRALLAHYCRTSFASPAVKCDILGDRMTFDAFVVWIREFTKCMVDAVQRGQLPNVDEVVRVVTRHQLTRLQDEAVAAIKSEFARVSRNGTKHIPPEHLEILLADSRRRKLEQFKKVRWLSPRASACVCPCMCVCAVRVPPSQLSLAQRCALGCVRVCVCSLLF
jgi:hypothetical protein